MKTTGSPPPATTAEGITLTAARFTRSKGDHTVKTCDVALLVASATGFAFGVHGSGAGTSLNMAEVRAAKLDPTDMPVILECLRRWHRDGVWGG